MKSLKLSFLIAAHNEEKIIAKTLSNLISLPYSNYEIIIGLDGCTDNTENIVKKFKKKSKKIKYYKLNLRSGKPEVIDKIIKKAKGDIIIINDADWLFFVKNKKIMQKFISVFDNPNIGGIAESFPVEWNLKKIKKSNLGYKMVAYSSYLWLKFQKQKLTYKKSKFTYLKSPKMFLTNIFRKNLYSKNKTLGDDFERTKTIIDKGYNVILFPEISMPRMVAIYNNIPVKDLFKQKIRTAIARSQLKDNNQNIGIKYYLFSVSYIFFNSWKFGFSIGFIILFWIILTTLATFFAKFQHKDTKEGWKMRINRN